MPLVGADALKDALDSMFSEDLVVKFHGKYKVKIILIKELYGHE